MSRTRRGSPSNRGWPLAQPPSSCLAFNQDGEPPAEPVALELELVVLLRHGHERARELHP